MSSGLGNQKVLRTLQSLNASAVAGWGTPGGCLGNMPWILPSATFCEVSCWLCAYSPSPAASSTGPGPGITPFLITCDYLTPPPLNSPHIMLSVTPPPCPFLAVWHPKWAFSVFLAEAHNKQIEKGFLSDVQTFVISGENTHAWSVIHTETTLHHWLSCTSTVTEL